MSAPLFGQKWMKWKAEADTLYSQQEYKKAIPLYSKVIKSVKDDKQAMFDALYKRAVSYYSTDQFQATLEDLNEFVKGYPSVPQARILRALVHRQLDHEEQMLNDLAEALRADPSNPGLLKWRASIYLDIEKYDLAKKDLETVKLFTEDTETEMYLGIAQYNLGQVDDALESLKKAISLDPTNLTAYLYGSSFCLQEDRYTEALEYVDFVLRLDPGNETALFYKGISLVELERTDEGCRCLRKSFYGGNDDAGDYLEQYCFGKL
jgi:tetratricopeptide (TPR) repeat protein